MDRVNTLRNAYEFIVTFLETMVESTVDVQKENQTLLRQERGCVRKFRMPLLAGGACYFPKVQWPRGHC